MTVVYLEMTGVYLMRNDSRVAGSSSPDALPLPQFGRGEMSKRGTVTVPLQAVSCDNLPFGN